MKPSVDAPTIAAKFFELLEEAGLPDGVVNLCPGEGPEFGSEVVAHPQTRFIAFTGSKAVGLEIHERAAKTMPGQVFIKRTILEMGGKDSIIVEPDCDLDAAVEGVVASAFGFNGQKCSACSRAIVAADIYDVFCDRLQERVAKIKTGDPAENIYTGPVISEFWKSVQLPNGAASGPRKGCPGKTIACVRAYRAPPRTASAVPCQSKVTSL